MRWIDYFDLGWSKDPTAPCLVDDDAPGGPQTFSYDAVRSLTIRIANAMTAAGFPKGSHGAVLSPNHPMSVGATLALMRAGLVWVPLNPRNGLADNADILRRFDCEILFYHSEFADALPLFRERAPGIRQFVCLDKPDGPASLETFIAGHPAEMTPVPWSPTDTVMMAGTGGTTGEPKGVEQTHRATEIQTLAIMAVMPFRERPVYMAVAPLTHATGYITYPIFAQAGTVVLQRAPDVARILSAIPRHRVRCLFLPPTVIYALLAHPTVGEIDFSSLEYFIYGASPMSPARLREAIAVIGPVFFQMFGQTETLFPLTWLSREDHFVDGRIGGEVAPDERLRTCGFAAPAVELAIMDEDGNLLPDDSVGEIVCRTEMLMKGYYKDPDATAEANAHGWFHTGDMGTRDGDGFYYIVDRKKDMIITGGFNVYSTEVEAALLSHPAVGECAVVGAPHEKWGEAITAVVELKPGEAVSTDALIAHCKERIGSVKAPKAVEFVDAIPRSAVGKVLKREIRDRFWAGEGRKVG